MTETELMPRLVVDYTELAGSKLKKGKGFLEPNFGVGPNWACQESVHSVTRFQVKDNRKSSNGFSGCLVLDRLGHLTRSS